MKFKTRLMTFGKPDSKGQYFEGPVDFSRLWPKITFNFSDVGMGVITEITQDDEGVGAILDLSDLPKGYVPVCSFSVPVGIANLNGQPVDGVWRGISLSEVFLVKEKEAHLPADFCLLKVE